MKKLFIAIAVAVLSFVSFNASASSVVNPQSIQEISAQQVQSEIIVIIVETPTGGVVIIIV